MREVTLQHACRRRTAWDPVYHAIVTELADTRGERVIIRDNVSM